MAEPVPMASAPATFAAQAARSVFGVAAAEWITTRSEDFPGPVRRTLSDLRDAIATS
ncbi:hypothetical protein L083_3557 [Actinoplanes sp. N902-109]|nr:hypothetical protein L083_3557 [Actinoplanes sp. N902-109]